MEDGFKRISITEMGETLRVSRVASDYAEGGPMRAFMGSDYLPSSLNQSTLERAAVIAFSTYHDAGKESEGYDRDMTGDRMARALRIVVVNQADVDGVEQSDLQRAHAILKTLALVERMEARADGQVVFEPSSAIVETLLRDSRIDAESVTRDDANRFAMGMADMMQDPIAIGALRHATSPAGLSDEDLVVTQVGNRLSRFDCETAHPSAEGETMDRAEPDLAIKGASPQVRASAHAENGR